jgi:hypothetical protein
LVSSTSLPTGVQLLLDPTMEDHPSAPSADPEPCGGIIMAFDIVRQTDAPAADASVGLQAHESLPWMGRETLSSYSADGAQKVVREIRSLVDRCPTATGPSGAGNILADPSLASAVNGVGPLTTHFSVAAGPQLGDESLRVRARTPSQVAGNDMEADAIVIRSGSTVLVVNELPTYAQFSKLDDVAAAAYRRLTTP